MQLRDLERGQNLAIAVEMRHETNFEEYLRYFGIAVALGLSACTRPTNPETSRVKENIDSSLR